MSFDRGTIHIDQALTNVSVKYKQDKYVAAQVLPEIMVAKQTGKYYIFGKEHFALDNDLRAKGAAANKVKSWSATTGTYSTVTHALADTIDAEDYANADNPINPQVEVTEGLTEKILLRREKALADTLFSGTTFSGYTAALGASDKWSNYTDSNPVNKINDIKRTVQKNCGMIPNSLLISGEVYDKLKEHPKLTDMFKYTTRGTLTKELVAQALGVDNLYIGEAIYNSSAEGVAASNGYIWGKYALLFYRTPNPSLRNPSLGYTINWSLYGGNSLRVRKWADDETESDVIEVATSYDMKVASVSSGYLLSTVIA